MEVKVENLQIFSWRKVEQTIELAFEEHSYTSSNNEDGETKNHDTHNLKKIEPQDAVLESQVQYSHAEGSKEIFHPQQRLPEELRLATQLEGTFEMDLTNKIHMTVERSLLPTINVKISQSEIKLFEEASAGKDWKLVVEVMFGEKSHSSNCQKYKIFKGGVSGLSRRKYTKNDVIEFKNLRVNYHTTVDKNSKIIILLYYLTEGKKTVIRQVLISKDLFIIQENKLINIDTQQALKQYFDLFGPQFMDKLPASYRVNKNDKHNLNEEITKFEQYMLKKNKRFLNVVFLSFKFPHFCQLYFKVPDNINEQDAPEQAFNIKKTALSNCLTDAIKQIQDLKIENSAKLELLCNHLNPKASLIFRININLRRVRIFIRKEFTQMLNIIVSEEFEQPVGFGKFHSAKQLKQFYLQYYTYAKKCKSTEGFTKPGHFGSSGLLPNPNDQHLSAGGIQKKPIRRADDEEYHDQDLQQEQQSENQEASNEGCKDALNLDSGDKKNKKPTNMLKKLYANKKPGNLSPKENKYPTRGKAKVQEPESQNNESKRNAMTKKIKEKEVQKKPSTMGGMVPGVGMVNPMMSMPFQMIPPGGQGPMMGMFPMMQNAQKKDGVPIVGANGQKPGPQMNAIQMGIQGMPGMQGMAGMAGMAGMSGMPQGISIAGGMPQGMFSMPGMMPGGFSGMPFAMMNPNAQQQGNKKENAKDGKQQASGSNQAAKPGVQMMMPMQLGQGMGMQMPMMGGMGSPMFQMMPGGMPQGVMGMQGQGMPGMQGMQGMMPMAIQGPNGQTIMVMSMMPQQMQGNSQQNGQQASSTSSNSGNQAQNQQQQQQQQQNIQAMMAGGIPMGMMMPGMQGMQGMQPFQGMQGLQGLQGLQGMQGMQGLQALQGLQGMQGLQGLQGMQGMQGMMLPQGMMIGGQGQQLGVIGGNSQQNPNQGNNQIQGLNLGQLSGLGANGLPIGFVTSGQQNAQQNLSDQKAATDKNANSQNNPKLPEVKKPEPNKKQEKGELPPSSAPNNDTTQAQKHPGNTAGLPSFLTNSGQAAFPPIVGGIVASAANPQKEGQKPKTAPQQGFPPGVMMGMPGNGGGMIIPAEMLQQMSQGGQGMPQMMFPQGMMGGLPQGMQGLPQGMQGLPQGMQGMPQGIGMLPPGMGNLPPGVGVITPELLNSLPPQQRQMILQQMQGMGKMQMGFGTGGPNAKKDEQKK